MMKNFIPTMVAQTTLYVMELYLTDLYCNDLHKDPLDIIVVPYLVEYGQVFDWNNLGESGRKPVVNYVTFLRHEPSYLISSLHYRSPIWEDRYITIFAPVNVYKVGLYFI